MQVTRDVVKDLMTVYLAGDASPDTRTLVEEYLETDAELKREVATWRSDPLDLPPAPALEPSAEKKTLDATRQMIKTRSATQAVAIVFTLLPFSFVFEGSRITFLLIRDTPLIGITWWATAAVMWVWHVLVRRRLRVAGL